MRTGVDDRETATLKEPEHAVKRAIVELAFDPAHGRVKLLRCRRHWTGCRADVVFMDPPMAVRASLPRGDHRRALVVSTRTAFAEAFIFCALAVLFIKGIVQLAH